MNIEFHNKVNGKRIFHLTSDAGEDHSDKEIRNQIKIFLESKGEEIIKIRRIYCLPHILVQLANKKECLFVLYHRQN